MNIHDLIRELREADDTKIVLLVADGLGGLPAGAGRQDRAGDGPHAQPRRLRPRRRLRPEHPGAARHHARQRAGAPRPVRLRPARVPHRPRHPRSAGHQLPGRPAATWPSAATSAPSTTTGLITDRRAGRPTTERCVAMCKKLRDDQGPRRRGLRRAGARAPLRASSSAATAWATRSTTPTRSRSASPPLAGRRRGRRRRRRPPRSVNQFVAEAGRGAQGRRPDQHGDAARLRPLPEDRARCRTSTACKAACDRRLPDVQGPGPAGRHGRRSTPAARSPTRSRRSKKVWDEYDFFFLHYKYTDSTGEDGNFAAKVEMIEQLDAEIPQDPRAEPGRADRDRRPQHAEQAEEPLAGTRCRRCCGPKTCRPDGGDGVRRVGLPARRPGAVPGEAPDAAGDGPRRPAGQVRGVRAAPLAASRIGRSLAPTYPLSRKRNTNHAPSLEGNGRRPHGRRYGHRTMATVGRGAEPARAQR